MGPNEIVNRFNNSKFPPRVQEILGGCIDAMEIGQLNYVQSAAKPLADLPVVPDEAWTIYRAILNHLQNQPTQ